MNLSTYLNLNLNVPRQWKKKAASAGSRDHGCDGTTASGHGHSHWQGTVTADLPGAVRRSMPAPQDGPRGVSPPAPPLRLGESHWQDQAHAPSQASGTARIAARAPGIIMMMPPGDAPSSRGDGSAGTALPWRLRSSPCTGPGENGEPPGARKHAPCVAHKWVRSEIFCRLFVRIAGNATKVAGRMGEEMLGALLPIATLRQHQGALRFRSRARTS
jgi:hypothetical protein